MDQHIAAVPGEKPCRLTTAHVVVGIDAAHRPVFPLYGDDGEP